MAKQHKFFAVVLPGLERIAARELETLSAHDIDITYGGVHFSGTMPLLYRVNLRARTITRVLMRLRTFRTMTLEGLKYDLEKVAWHLFFDDETKLEVDVQTHHSRLNHSDEIAAFSKTVIQKCLPKLGSSPKHLQTVHVRIDNNRGTLSLDTSGERLDRRGYRLASGKAPLRETIAAAILQWTDWKPEQTLLVPMCGSGTLAIEAALMGLNIAANANHDFSFQHFASFKDKAYQSTLTKALGMKKTSHLDIQATDYNDAAVEISQQNAERAGVADAIDIQKQDIHLLTKPENEKGGLVLLNPPYGQRIGEDTKIMSLWVDIGKMITEKFSDDTLWRIVIVCPDHEHENALKLKVKRRLVVKHGGSDVMVLEI